MGDITQDQPKAPPLETPTTGMPPQANLELADGTDTGISQDAALQVGDAIDPYGQASIEFETGNYKDIIAFPQKLTDKCTLVNNTILPLIEKALIELLGTNSSYSRKSFVGAVTVNANTITMSIDVIYLSELFIGQDIEQENIMKDATYVYNTIKVVPGVAYRKCEIDTGSGEIRVSFTC